MTKFTGPLARYPARATFIWFAGLIACGTILLLLPASTAPGQPRLSFLDAAFTATSASCVTGLTVRSTAHDLSWFGQAVVLALMQLGGMGIITVTTYIAMQLGGRASLHHKAVVAQTLGQDSTDLRWVASSVIRFVLAFELAGFALLTLYNLATSDRGLVGSAWHGLFHAVSAFCNAGFSLQDDSLVRYQDSPLVNLVIMSLIVVGGIGFPVAFDLRRNWNWNLRAMWPQLTLHTKLMLIGSTALIAFGTTMILLLEWNHALGDSPWWQRGMAAIFQSVALRTAGFQTVDLAMFHEATLFLMVLVMIIGGGPCSTAGGIKVSTVMVLVCQSWSKFQGSQRATIFRRSIPPETISGALATALLFGVVAAGALTAVLVAQPRLEGSFLFAFFEVASALGTVGASVYRDAQNEPTAGSLVSYTSQLTITGRWIVIVLMFTGRLGPISVFLALSRSERKDRIEYPREEILVG